MESSVSVIVANMVIETIKERVLTTFCHSPRFWARYVDDASVTILKKYLEQFFDYLHLVEATIKLTLETVKNGRILFLDVLVVRQPGGSIKTNLYKKNQLTRINIEIFVLVILFRKNVA